MWTRERMVGYLRRRLGDRRLIVVANREPYVHEQTPEEIRCIEPDGGLIAALDPILRGMGGTWIAHGSGSGDRQTADDGGRLRVPPGISAYTLRRVWLNRQEEDGFYYRCCHQGIWPLCHSAHHRPVFDPDAWKEYVRVNERFAQAVVEEAGSENCLVLIQNYHFALLPRLLRNQLPSAVIAQFWHIPWPSPDVFRSYPWRKEILNGVLGSDLVSFHLQEHCESFLESVTRELTAEVDPALGTVVHAERTTRIRPDAMSVDFEEISQQALSPATVRNSEDWRTRLSLGSRRVLLSVGRFDYAEGVPERIRAYGRLLELHPEYRGKIVLLEVAIPIRGNLPSYRRFESEAMALIDEVNRTYGTPEWRPVTVISEHQSRTALTALYGLADVCMVTSLHDGLSLIAKEYVSARPDGRGTLVLSSYSGTARELRGATHVNPYDVGEMAGAIRHVLELPAAEREGLFLRLRSIVQSRNVFRWAGKLFKEALAARSSIPIPQPIQGCHGNTAGQL